MSHIRYFASRQQAQPASAEPYSFTDTISANTNNYDIRAAAIADGWDGVEDLDATITINSGVYVGSVSTATAAIDTNSSGSFPAATTIEIINNGYVIGRGGDGGAGGLASALSGGSETGGDGVNGSPAGDALRARLSMNVTNNGTFAGGGGGGGGGGGAAYSSGGYGHAFVGCGGAAGQGGGSGGAAGTKTDQVTPITGYIESGSSSAGGDSSYHDRGTRDSSGTYCYEWVLTTNSFKSTAVTRAQGGSGGLAGLAGSGGSSGGTGLDNAPEAFDVGLGGSGGAAGDYVNGSANVTWDTVGTRLGGAS